MKLSEWMAGQNPAGEKVTDEAFAERVRADRTYICKIRRGLKAPSLDLAGRIKAATEGAVTADDFLPQTEAAE